MSDEPSQVTINLHTSLPEDEKTAQALWEHLRDLAADCTRAGWSVAIVVAMSKIEPEPSEGATTKPG